MVNRFTKCVCAQLLTLMDQLHTESLVLDDAKQPDTPEHREQIEELKETSELIRQAYCRLARVGRP